jgi:hypothetical protein
MNDPNQTELFSDWDALVLARSLIRDLHDDLPRRVSRFRYIADISASMGEGGTLIFGGHAASNAYLEARSSFVNGNFIATILLCQSLIENLLAAYLHATSEALPAKVKFVHTLQRCKSKGFVNDEDEGAIKRLIELRNPLMHFRDVNDADNLMRRSMNSDIAADELLERDAHFAIGVAIKILSKEPFKIGNERLHPRG